MWRTGMITNIGTDKYHIIESNMILLFEKDANLTLSFKFDDFLFDIKLIFNTDDSIEGGITKNVNGNKIEIKCTNFNNSLGTGTIKPIDIAIIDGKNLYIHFWSHLYTSEKDASVRKLEYTVFLER